MPMYKEFNSTCIILVAFFDPKHFLVENGTPESIYFLTPNTQYYKYTNLATSALSQLPGVPLEFLVYSPPT